MDYDKDKSLVTATGHVEAWQNGHVMRADKITFDRNTGVAAAIGHVVLLEPDGEVMFADYAEMQNNMSDGILKDMRALLQQNGRLAANGAQRTGGQINELSKVVYTTCNLCAKDPSTAAAMADPGVFGGAGPGAQEDRIPGCDAGDVRRPGRLFPVFLACRSVGEAGIRACCRRLSARRRISAVFTDSLTTW